MKSQLLVMLSVLIVILGVTIPTVAQDDWPEGCELPDLEEAMSAANDAQVDGDRVAYLYALGNIMVVANETYIECFEVLATSGNDLVGASLNFSRIRPAKLNNANLQEAELMYVNLPRADLRGANLQGANLSGANLQGAELSSANLQDAYLINTNLDRVSMLATDLQDAYLAGADLYRATLWFANFQGVTFCESGYIPFPTCADLTGADLDAANLKAADLTNRAFSEATTLPDGIGGWSWSLRGPVCESGCWTPDTDMDRFTDPEHPDFWDPCVELDWTPLYCEDEGE